MVLFLWNHYQEKKKNVWLYQQLKLKFASLTECAKYGMWLQKVQGEIF